MPQEMDISWHVLCRIAQQWGGETAELAEVRPLDGGCINTTVALVLADGRKAVCKISPHRVDHSYINEAHQLGVLAAAGMPTPAVYAAKVGSLDDPFSYILMEFVEGITLAEARRICTAEEYDALQCNLAELLLQLHERTADGYGREEIEPPKKPYESWPEFFRHVFDPICKSVVKSDLLPVKARRHVSRIHDRLDRLLDHDDVPRLVHWDVWSTNVLTRRGDDGMWRIAALLDPCCKFAHVEAELAYMALFHTSTPAFMKAYQRHRRLCEAYHRVRKPVYQLYFLLNHVHLFGAEYVAPVLSTLGQLAPVV